ncbi:MAG: hypothetical protein ACREQB_02995 [Candidatus Binataceae bacterium]
MAVCDDVGRSLKQIFDHRAARLNAIYLTREANATARVFAR